MFSVFQVSSHPYMASFPGDCMTSSATIVAHLHNHDPYVATMAQLRKREEMKLSQWPALSPSSEPPGLYNFYDSLGPLGILLCC